MSRNEVTHVPFLDVDRAKAELGLSRLRPTVVICLECGEPRRAALGSHTCLWCEISQRRGYPVYPCRHPQGELA